MNDRGFGGVVPVTVGGKIHLGGSHGVCYYGGARGARERALGPVVIAGNGVGVFDDVEGQWVFVADQVLGQSRGHVSYFGGEAFNVAYGSEFGGGCSVVGSSWWRGILGVRILPALLDSLPRARLPIGGWGGSYRCRRPSGKKGGCLLLLPRRRKVLRVAAAL